MPLFVTRQVSVWSAKQWKPNCNGTEQSMRRHQRKSRVARRNDQNSARATPEHPLKGEAIFQGTALSYAQ
jgi:hypothetical protein